MAQFESLLYHLGLACHGSICRFRGLYCHSATVVAFKVCSCSPGRMQSLVVESSLLPRQCVYTRRVPLRTSKSKKRKLQDTTAQSSRQVGIAQCGPTKHSTSKQNVYTRGLQRFFNCNLKVQKHRGCSNLQGCILLPWNTVQKDVGILQVAALVLLGMFKREIQKIVL